MKKSTIIAFLAGMATVGLLAFTFSAYEPKKSTAEVDYLQGTYVFVNSKPVSEFDYLGTVKSSISWTSQFSEIRDKLIKKAKADYPQSDGIMLNFTTGGTDHADVIKFK